MHDLAFFDKIISVKTEEKIVQNIRNEQDHFDENDRLTNKFTVVEENFSIMLDKKLNFIYKFSVDGFFRKIRNQTYIS